MIDGDAEIVLDEDIMVSPEQEITIEGEDTKNSFSQEDIEAIQMTKNINLLVFVFIAYSAISFVLVGFIFSGIFTYKHLEKLLLLPVLLFFIRHCVLIIRTIQKNSIEYMEVTDKGFSITENMNTFFINFENVAKVDIHTHRYTHLGMFKLLAVTTENFKTYNIIFKVDYDDDAIIDRIKYRLKNHDVKIE